MKIAEIYRMAEEFQVALGLRKFAKTPSAGFLFFCPEDKTVFLTHRSAHMSSPGTWDLPGGQPEDTDTSPIETANREAYEELGNIPKKTPVKSHSIKTDKHHYIVFLVPFSTQEKKAFTQKLSLSDESDGFEWFDYDEIPSNDQTHFDLSWITSEI